VQLDEELHMEPKAPLRLVDAGGGIPELPTVSGGFDQMANSLKSILDKLDGIDFEAIGRDLQGTLKGANAVANAPQMERALADLAASLASMRSILHRVEQRAEPLTANLEQALAAARDAMQKTSATMALMEGMLAPEAPMRDAALRLMQELGDTARSVRGLVELLERQPQSLIFGKNPPGGK
jgi:paraquat-inducible protein B